MFGSAWLEIVIAVSFVYFVISIACFALNEVLELVLRLRFRLLVNGIYDLLGIEFAKDVYGHPLVQGFLGTRRRRNASYIPPRILALALMDVLSGTYSGYSRTGAEKVDTIRRSLSALMDSPARQALRAFVEAAGENLVALQDAIETWFIDLMNEISDSYRRRVQISTLVIAFALAVAINADTVAMLNSPPLTSAGLQYLQLSPDSGFSTAFGGRLSDTPPYSASLVSRVLAGPNVGWSSPNSGVTLNNIGKKIMGWLLTALAVSLFVSLCFDLLNGISRRRYTVKRPNRAEAIGTAPPQAPSGAARFIPS